MRPELLRELLNIELELRHNAGETPELIEYQNRFPEHADLVATVFASAPSPDSSRPMSDPAETRDLNAGARNSIDTPNDPTGVGSRIRYFGDFEILEILGE